jgi:hypothetical protein
MFVKDSWDVVMGWVDLRKSMCGNYIYDSFGIQFVGENDIYWNVKWFCTSPSGENFRM